jgi:hypothetical protein
MSIIAAAKEANVYITANDLDGLKSFYEDIKNTPHMDWEYIFKECYLHACLKKRQTIVTWLQDLFNTFDPISKIGLRQLFFYGKYLLSK